MPSLGVADTARALAGLRDDLERAVRATAEQIVSEPRLELKSTLAARLRELTLAVRDLEARIEELGGADTPSPGTAHELLQRIDPLVDEATLRIITGVLHRERRHADELDPRLHPPRDRVPELDDDPHVQAAEEAARLLLERDDPDFRADMARIAADCMRHAIVATRTGAAEHIAADETVHARIRARWKV